MRTSSATLFFLPALACMFICGRGLPDTPRPLLRGVWKGAIHLLPGVAKHMDQQMMICGTVSILIVTQRSMRQLASTEKAGDWEQTRNCRQLTRRQSLPSKIQQICKINLDDQAPKRRVSYQMWLRCAPCFRPSNSRSDVPIVGAISDACILHV